MQSYDLIVVGGGINGAAISRDAAMRGLRTLLLEANDFAFGASGHNGRMIHGGLRYLENADIGLVTEALRERATLLRIAPHLVRRSTLLLPVMRGGRHPAWKVRLGLAGLDALSLAWSMRHRKLTRREVMDRVPAIRGEALQAGFLMQDAMVDHAERLTLEMVLAATEAGADVHNRSPVSRISPRVAGGLSVAWQEDGASQSARAPVVVNATGAWVDDVLSMAAGVDAALTTRALGSFMVVRSTAVTPREAVFVESRQDGRPVLVAPWQGNILVGTTDRQISGRVEDECTTAAEIDYLFAALDNVFQPGTFSRSDILYTYWGVRSLPAAKGPSHQITRKHVTHRHGAPLEGLISVFGGKLSTCRSLAEEATDAVFGLLNRPVPKSLTAHTALPGARPPTATRPLSDQPVSPLTAARLASVYGTRAALVRDIAARSPDLAAVIDATTGAIAAEIVFAVQHEFARSLSDILLRRTMLGFGTDRARRVYGVFRAVALRHLNWAEARIDQDIQDYETYLSAGDGPRVSGQSSLPAEKWIASR